MWGSRWKGGTGGWGGGNRVFVPPVQDGGVCVGGGGRGADEGGGMCVWCMSTGNDKGVYLYVCVCVGGGGGGGA